MKAHSHITVPVLMTVLVSRTSVCLRRAHKTKAKQKQKPRKLIKRPKAKHERPRPGPRAIERLVRAHPRHPGVLA